MATLNKMKKKSYLTMGVIGGMGPDATVDFLSRVVSNTPAEKDQNHIPMLIDHRPQIPNRHHSIDGSGENVVPYLTAMAKGLESSGANFLVMPCNTAHAYAKDIREAVSIPFIHLIDETVAQIKKLHPGIQSVGIMAAKGCLDSKLYQDTLENNGYHPVCWDEADAKEFMTLVFQIKAGDKGKNIQQAMLALANKLLGNGAELLIAACTEIPLVLNASDISSPMLVSTDILATQSIAYARGEIPLP
jgi:aspartate racemase